MAQVKENQYLETVHALEASVRRHSETPTLPPGWTQRWDPNMKKYMYLEKATGRIQWSPPALPEGPSGQRASYSAPSTNPNFAYALSWANDRRFSHHVPPAISSLGNSRAPSSAGLEAQQEKRTHSIASVADTGGVAVSNQTTAPPAPNDPANDADEYEYDYSDEDSDGYSYDYSDEEDVQRVTGMFSSEIIALYLLRIVSTRLLACHSCADQ